MEKIRLPIAELEAYISNIVDFTVAFPGPEKAHRKRRAFFVHASAYPVKFFP